MTRERARGVSARVGTNVRSWRERRALSQHELAAKLGRPDSQVSRLELGKTAITVDQLVEYAAALNVAPSTLLGVS